MRFMSPHVDVPGDNAEPITLPDGSELRARIMGRSGDLVGGNSQEAVWRFGFLPESESAHAYGVSIPERRDEGHGFMWVLATRKTGHVREVFHGYAVELPANFNGVIDGWTN